MANLEKNKEHDFLDRKEFNDLRRRQIIWMLGIFVHKFERRKMDPNYNPQITITKMLKGVVGVAIAYIILYLFGGKIPGTEQVSQLTTQLQEIVNQIFLVIGVVAGLYQGIENLIKHMPKRN